MAHWLLKTEPTEYSFADLARDKRATWDGISNAQALIYMRQAAKDDLAFIYHTGNEKQIVGIARLTSAARPDQSDASGKAVVFDVKPVKPLPTPVTLARIKSDGRFSNFALVRNSRLAVMPVDGKLWDAIVGMGGL